ncbi:hypothetical protein [Phytohabitans kaempferiae]|uniref:Lipoprotein n=1 Tax=Phytohabitans kaempferiae TaxID=1620943 RepID=A0ABV6LWD0_9ACTN
MRRMMYLAVVGAASATVMAVTTGTAAIANVDTSSLLLTDCVVRHLDERGGVADSSTERHGSVLGQFRCTNGKWELLSELVDRRSAFKADEVVKHVDGTVSVRKMVSLGSSHDLTIAERTGLLRAVTGDATATIEGAIVAVDDGRERTEAELQALLAGNDTTGVRVVGQVNLPAAGQTQADIIGQVGGDPGGDYVLYFWSKIIKLAAAAVVWAAEKIYDSCTLNVTPRGFEIRCQF